MYEKSLADSGFKYKMSYKIQSNNQVEQRTSRKIFGLIRLTAAT